MITSADAFIYVLIALIGGFFLGLSYLPMIGKGGRK